MRVLLISLLLIMLTACSAGPRLEQPSAAFPQDLRFAGTWDRVDTQVDDRMRSSGPGLVIPRNQRLAVSTDNRKEPGMLARSFLERGQVLKITQLDSALLISFDRAIVEEYRYGELRIASIGPIRAERSAGFRGDILEILTLDSDSALMVERWELQANDQLQRSVSLTQRQKPLLFILETYQRRR